MNLNFDPYIASTSSADVLSENKRIIVINATEPPTMKFPRNKIHTAKYNVFKFLPVFLYEQFRRWANIFFLVVALMQQVPNVSPTGRYTTLSPLIFILSISAIKEIIEDVKRHRSDNEINKKRVDVLRETSWTSIFWEEVNVGDIVRVLNDSQFPADIIALSSSASTGISYIETVLLDGEGNLKRRQALQSTCFKVRAEDFADMSGIIECGLPSRRLYEFNGVLTLSHAYSEPIESSNIFLRGSILRNTEWVIGIVAYTGYETKLGMSVETVPLKRSSVDKDTNFQLLLLFFVLICISITCTIFNHIWEVSLEQHYYLNNERSTINILYTAMTFAILFNNLIPISLNVTLEVVRVLQAIFINVDIEMYDEKTDTPAVARTSNLNEELGQVRYIFADKTGTLTQNIMKFQKCAIRDTTYTLEQLKQKIQHDPLDPDIHEFLMFICICHTVIPEKMSDGTIRYNASSADENALLKGVSELGYVFKYRSHKFIEISARGDEYRYEVLAMQEFTSERMRMSVLARDVRGNVKLYCKGADTVMYKRLDDSGRKQVSTLLTYLDVFAEEGLRTLCCATAEISEQDYQIWNIIHQRASICITEVEKKLTELADMIERNMKLIGVTGIEDKLQVGVPETITSLQEAGIILWVLTGDKLNTAMNVGYASKLISRDMHVLNIDESTLKRTYKKMVSYYNSIGDNVDSLARAMIISGESLEFVLLPKFSFIFVELFKSCKVVICCRMSPIQKANVVVYVRKHTNAITLAIGDGANDVAMIRKAHVGIGISGLEGMQAAFSSDYSIAQFRFLKRLLLVHGAWNYARISKMILYSYYKNICFNIIQFWYAIYSGWSGQVLFERWSMAMYNVIFTAVQPVVIGVFDKTCDSFFMMKYPLLYKPSQNGELFNIWVFSYWIGNAIFHSILLYWLTLLITEHTTLWQGGFEGGYLVIGTSIYTYVIVTVSLKAGLVTNAWTWLTHFSIWGSIITWCIFVIIYGLVWPLLPLGNNMAGMYTMMYSSAVFWFGLFFIPAAVLLPDTTFQIIRCTILKSPTDKVREIARRKNALIDH